MEDIALVYFIFNRPEKTKVSFDAIRKAKPKNLVIYSDGPKNKIDIEKVNLVRAIVSVIDWDCRLTQINHAENIGCKSNILNGIGKVLETFEKVIIIEDDIVINQSFIDFCSKMLYKYEFSENIYAITGFNGLLKNAITNQDGFLSKRHCNWGWATWKRAWKDFKDLQFVESTKMTDSIDKYFNHKFPANLYKHVFNDKQFTNENWDILWDLYMISKDGYSISSSINLIKNIGFDKEGTRTVFDDLRSTFPTFEFQTQQVEFSIKETYDEKSRSVDEANYLLRIICTYSEPKVIFHYFKSRNFSKKGNEGWVIQLEPFFKAERSIALLKHIETYHPVPEITQLRSIFERAKKLHEN